MPERVTIIWNRPALYTLLHSPNGDLGRYLHRRGVMMRAVATAKVGKSTGMLARSIYLEQEATKTGQKMVLGASSRHALLHHEGTRPHIIRARGNGTLRFASAGRVVYSRQVMHPGTRPNRFLSSTLPMILL